MHPESLEYQQAEDEHWARARKYSVQARPGWWDVVTPGGAVVSTWNDEALAAEECRFLNLPLDERARARPRKRARHER